MLRISEIFTSIQGESTYSGLPCTFIRLSGCNLACRWCDTPHARSGGRERSVDELFEEVSRRGCSLVEVTGGEPLIQADTFELVERLCEAGYGTLVETNGTVDLTPLDRRAIVIMDIKCPGSGEPGSLLASNLVLLREKDEIKFVIASRDDYEWARDFIIRNRLSEISKILLSPVHGELEPRILAGWILEEGVKARLQLQLHKYIWPDIERGV